MSPFSYEQYEGRPFVWGSSDCQALFIDLYREQFGIEVTNYARPTNWDADKIDLIRACYDREGFEMIPRESMRPKDLRPGDVACVAIGASRANHFAVYVGDNKIVHHKANCFSSSELFRDFWKHRTSYYLRHPKVPDMRPQYPDVDIRDLIGAARSFKVPSAD